jgi:HEAT repeat protein
VRAGAADALGRIGVATGGVVSALSERLADESASVRSAAVGALGALGPKAGDAVEPLVALLRSEDDAGVRARVADALTEIGTPRARAAAEDYMKSASNR